MPELEEKYVYHMEFGTEPLSIYQLRPFRPKEKPSWKLEEKDFSVYSNCFKVSFGTTPPEGIELKLFRIPSFSSMRKEAINDILDLPLSKRQKFLKIRKELFLHKEEKIYIDIILEENYAGHSTTIKAIRRVRPKIGRKTLLYQEGMHNYFSDPIDIMLPKPKVFAGSDGLDFISHDWFRIAQHYDIVLLGGNIHKATGRKMRVYSDGINARIV